ncbi:hypothetical protein J0656_17125 [Muricauda ruestringensis]|uniref:Arm DNA-binding domain-containing protein n=1 Tax=Flagellimonas aurea TaxID=2915619 RepID=A0ABS3G8J6_9FLAO|nr:hypothetical protein [Allomuricauda aurea]
MVSLLLYLRKYKKDRVGRSTIYVRITIDGKRAEFSTGRKVQPRIWDAAYGKVLGVFPRSKAIKLLFEQNTH